MQNLSTKEVNYIRDLLSWELLAVKKCHEYATQETHPTHKKTFEEATAVHKQNYMNLLGYVDSVIQKQGGQNLS